MEPDPEFRKQVKEALDNLYNTAYLETHPLLSRFSTREADSRLTRAQRLRGLLKETIEALRPQEGSPTTSPEWRSYLALRYRYVQGMSPGEIELELGISLRQLQRELHQGLDAVAALLWEKQTQPPAAPTAAQELQSELDQWEISRASCEIPTLVDDTLWMLRPLLDERGVSVRVDVPHDLAPVVVDATLTRQSLFRIVRLLARAHPPGIVDLRLSEEEKQSRWVFAGLCPADWETEEDWQVVRHLCKQQGIRLDATRLADGRLEIALTLPRAAQRRILVVDDNAAIHQLFERYLAPHRYGILHAHSGPEALRIAAETQPDAITLDVMMPNVDGWQVLRGLTGHPATAHIPVIICSVLKEPELAFSLGARAYLKKPVDRLELVATLARLLSPASPAAEAPPSTPEDN